MRKILQFVSGFALLAAIGLPVGALLTLARSDYVDRVNAVWHGQQSHEVGYTGAKVAKKAGTTASRGRRAVKKAKQQTRSVSRKKVERKAVRIAR